MSSVNKVILIGNLGADPEVRTLENGTKLARISLATTEVYKDKTTGEKRENTEWHRVVLWRKLAEIVELYVKKGHKIYLEGKLQTNSYVDNGVTKYSTEIVAQNLTMLTARTTDGTQQPVVPSHINTPNPLPSASDNESDQLPF